MASKTKSKPLPIQQATKMPDSDFERVSENRRIKDVESARSIFNRMQTDNSLRFSQVTNVRNQLEGGRPFDPKHMSEQAADWQTNINFGDAQSARNRALLPFWRMINGSPTKIAVKMLGKSPNNGKYQAAFAEAFDEFLENWQSEYFIEFMNFASNFVNFGPGIVHWSDKESARWKAVNVQRVLWPKNARMAPTEWEVMAFVQDMTPSDLYKKIRTPADTKRSEFLGWNSEAIKAAIVTFNTGVFSPDPRDYTRWQDMLVNNDIAVATPYEPLQLVWLYVKQFDGKIGSYCFTQQGGVDEFIFKDEDYEEEYRRILGAVWYDTGTDSMIHSIKGFGIKNFFFSALQNRVKSRFVDAGIFSFGLNFQRDEDNVPDEAPPVENYGPVTIFPPGMKQLAVFPQIQQGAGIIEMLESNQADNNSQYREAQKQIEDTDTATQAKILASMQGEMSEATAAIFLSQFGQNIYSEQVRRLRKRGSTDEDAIAFQNYLKDCGVPDEVIFEAKIRVKTAASSGMSNPAMRAMKFQQALGLRNIPGVNGRWILEQYMANDFGTEGVQNGLMPEGADSNPMQRRQALMENQDFGQGQPLPVAPEDAHYEHLQEHLKPLAQIAMQFRGTGNITPEQVTALTIGLEHSSEHMQYLSEDSFMKAEFQQVNGTFREIQSVARGILTRLGQQSNNPQSPTPIRQPA